MKLKIRGHFLIVFKSLLLRFFGLFILTIYSNLVIAQDLVGTSKQILGDYIVGTISSNTPDFIKYLDAEYKYSADNPDDISITALSAISEDANSSFFNQTTITRHDDNTTLNLGFGYRSLLNDDKYIVGLNLFYDREINVTHQRFGVGIEFLTSIFDIRSNYYESFSDTKLVEKNETEKALDGWDVRLDYYIPRNMVGDYSVSAFVELYDWSESGGDFTVDGYKVGFASNLYRNFYLETGIDDDGTNDKDFYLVLNYAFKFDDEEIGASVGQEGLAFESVRHRMYEKVLRENRIIKVVKGAVKVKRGN